jgi:hypothetical protein
MPCETCKESTRLAASERVVSTRAPYFGLQGIHVFVRSLQGIVALIPALLQLHALGDQLPSAVILQQPLLPTALLQLPLHTHHQVL